MWVAKIKFLHTQSRVDYALTTKEAPKGSKRICDKDNKTYCGLLLHYMIDSMYHIYIKMQNAMRIWEALKSKYDSDDTGIKKYASDRWLSFKLTDDKPILK